MLPLIILIFLHVVTAAIPMNRVQDPMVMAMDDMDGIIMEIPDYDDPALVEYELKSMGGQALMPFLQMLKPNPSVKNGKASAVDKLAQMKMDLDDIILKLQIAREKLETGSKTALYDEIEQAFQTLKRLERSFRPTPNISQLIDSVLQSFPIPLMNSQIFTRTRTRPVNVKVIKSTEVPSPLKETSTDPSNDPKNEPTEVHDVIIDSGVMLVEMNEDSRVTPIETELKLVTPDVVVSHESAEGEPTEEPAKAVYKNKKAYDKDSYKKKWVLKSVNLP